jgi:hypothetical protein
MEPMDRRGNVCMLFIEASSERHASLKVAGIVVDFTHFRETGRSVTGLDYQAWKMGPVPPGTDAGVG